MLLLTTTSDAVSVYLSTSGAVDVHADWVDYAASVPTPGRTNTAVTAAGATTIVAAPLTSTTRNVKAVYVRNKTTSSALNVIVRHTDGTTTVELTAIDLDPGEQMSFIEGRGWKKDVLTELDNSDVTDLLAGINGDTSTLAFLASLLSERTVT